MSVDVLQWATKGARRWAAEHDEATLPAQPDQHKTPVLHARTLNLAEVFRTGERALSHCGAPLTTSDSALADAREENLGLAAQLAAAQKTSARLSAACWCLLAYGAVASLIAWQFAHEALALAAR